VLVTVGLAVGLAVNACSTASAPEAPTTQPASTALSVLLSPTPVTPMAVLGATLSATPIAVPTNPPNPQPAVDTSPASSSEFKAVAEAMAAAKSYRMSLTSTNATRNEAETFQVDVVKPDRLHTKAELGGQVFEAITIGQDSYVRLAGKWTKLTSSGLPASDLILSSDPQKVLSQIDSATQLKGTVSKGGIDQMVGY
jgi:hypothetical protein